MPTLNEVKYSALLALTGATPPITLNELEMLRLTQLGHLTGTLTERYHKQLDSRGVPPGPLNQRIYETLLANGYSGTLNEMLYQYWSDGGASGDIFQVVEGDFAAEGTTVRVHFNETVTAISSTGWSAKVNSVPTTMIYQSLESELIALFTIGIAPATGQSVSISFDGISGTEHDGTVCEPVTDFACTETGYGRDMVLLTYPINAGGRFAIVCRDVGVFNAVIDWGDSYDPDVITSYNQSELTHFYDDEGPTEYVIRISGQFPNIGMNLSADALLLKEVLQIGHTGLLTLQDSFGSTGLQRFTAGNCDLSQVTNMQSCWNSCMALTSIDLRGVVMPLLTRALYGVYGCPLLTYFLNDESWDTGSIQDMRQFFTNCSSLDGNTRVDLFDISGINTQPGLTLLMENAPLSTERYDALLIAWNQQTFIQNMTVNFNMAKYTAGGAAEAARTNLINVKKLTITDGGPV